MLGGKMNFEHAYLYSPAGRLMSAAIARADGTVNVLGNRRVAAARRRKKSSDYLDRCGGCASQDTACDLKSGRRLTLGPDGVSN
jgi:hypothetical protein